ncbi:uncharacterized protein LOC128745528 [Sabethes cyaneus]|uniref:uncharacterized protein LOC128745528 n=1 Tax=Sabethes cyaneus TaxID=53552 RepID=UPI00237DCB29|nr:uncharacterized protein LOC128745528 [Sabethes cyaneus]
MLIGGNVVNSINRLELERVQSQLKGADYKLHTRKSAGSKSPLQGLRYSVSSLENISGNVAREDVIVNVTKSVQKHVNTVRSTTLKPSKRVKVKVAPKASSKSPVSQPQIGPDGTGQFIPPTPPAILAAILNSILVPTTPTISTTSTEEPSTTPNGFTTSTLEPTTVDTTATTSTTIDQTSTTLSSVTDTTTTEESSTTTESTTAATESTSTSPEGVSTTSISTSTEIITPTTNQETSTTTEITSTPTPTTPITEVSTTTEVITTSTTTESTTATTESISTTTEEVSTSSISTSSEIITPTPNQETSTTTEITSTPTPTTPITKVSTTTEVMTTSTTTESTTPATESTSTSTEEPSTTTISTSSETVTPTQETSTTTEITSTSTVASSTTTEEVSTTPEAVSDSTTTDVTTTTTEVTTTSTAGPLCGLPSNNLASSQINTLAEITNTAVVNDSPFGATGNPIQTASNLFAATSNGLQGLANQFITASSMAVSQLNDAPEDDAPTGITSQIQNIGNPIVEGLPNANIIQWSDTPVVGNAETAIQNLANLQNEAPPQGVAQDSSVLGFFQQLGSQISNGAVIDGIASQVQTITTQISEGLSSASNGGTTDKANTTNTTSLDQITIPLQDLTTQVPSVLLNASNAIVDYDNSTNSNGSSVNEISSQFQNIGNQITEAATNVINAFLGSTRNSTGNNTTVRAITSQLQNIRSQISEGQAANATSTIPDSNNSVVRISSNSRDIANQLQPVVSDNPTTITNPAHKLLAENGTKLDPETQNLLNELSPIGAAESVKNLVETLNANSSQVKNPVVNQLQNFGSQLLNINSALNWNAINKIPVIGGWFETNSNEKPLQISHRPTIDCPACEQVCGTINNAAVASRRFRIVGGNPVQPPNKYPWTVRFLYFNIDAGQGSLINDRAILTTASVARAMPLYSQATALLNVYDLQSKAEERLTKQVANIFPHPSFNPQQPYDKNIGIVIVDSPVPLSKTLVPICLPTSFDSYGGTEAVVAGWGANVLGGPSSPVPQEVPIPLYTDQECKLANSNLTNNNLCGGIIKPASEASLKSTCEGDDGAGLMSPSRINPSQLTLIGITIEVPGKGCANTHQPATFTNVQNFMDFIIFYGIGCGC